MTKEGIATDNIFPVLVEDGHISEAAVVARAARPESARLALDELTTLGIVTRTDDGWDVVDESLLPTFA